ncbi:MAG: hypothetical protein B7Y02_05580 [Rhodobacterales bacterium 17-64-5]|nr:MAG: hypothetical protein B7Y02_05580 [Rhodobacterales bacterium 17-64-5]
MSFNILAIGQSGRLEHEAILLAASLRHSDPGFSGRLYIAEPQPGGKWQGDPRMSDQTRVVLKGLGAEILPFTARVFGSDYPNGNKIEALAALPDAPFLFLDTDTLITGPLSEIAFDFTRPSASMKRENTWPKVELYGPTLTETWAALYDRFGLDLESSLDGSTLPLLYAVESDRAVAVLEAVARDKTIRPALREWEAMRLTVYQNKGQKARALFDRDRLPPREQTIRNTLKREGFWIR